MNLTHILKYVLEFYLHFDTRVGFSLVLKID